MQTCETPFFIWFTGRTGSTFLCDLLDSHPQIACQKEQFCEVKLDDASEFPSGARTYTNNAGVFGRQLCQRSPATKIDDPTDDQTLGYLGEIFNADATACGFKLKYPNQAQCYPEIVEQLRSIAGLKVVELVRENVLKQAISLRNVARIQQLGVSRWSNAVEAVELEPLELDVPLTIRHANYFLRTRNEFHQFTSLFNDVLPLRYEQLVADDAAIEQVLEFLNVNTDVMLQSEFKKTTPDRISQAVANYDELAMAIQGTELEQFLD